MNGQLYFTDNGRDWLSEDLPEDELNRVTKVGEDFGAPCLFEWSLAGKRWLQPAPVGNTSKCESVN